MKIELELDENGKLITKNLDLGRLENKIKETSIKLHKIMQELTLRNPFGLREGLSWGGGLKFNIEQLIEQSEKTESFMRFQQEKIKQLQQELDDRPIKVINNDEIIKERFQAFIDNNLDFPEEERENYE